MSSVISEPVPILLLVREPGVGGSERQMAETAKALDRRRWRPFAGCFSARGMRATELRDAGVPLIEFPVRSFVHASLLSEGRRLGQFLKQQNIQLVHSFDVPTNLFAAPAARAFRRSRHTPVILTSQRAYRTLVSGVQHRLLRLTDRLADGIVVNCDAMRRHLEDEEGVPSSRIHVCYNGLDLEALHAPSRERNDVTTIGVVCALRPEKGLRTLVEAFAALHRDRVPARLLIVGSGPMLGELQQLAQQFSLGDSCRFEPATSQVASWLARIDIFVLPSLSEALSNSLMEAMACGCAAVASNVGGNPELVRTGQTGLIFPPGDSAALASCLRTLVSDSGLREKMALQGSAMIRGQFSVDTAARRMDEIYTSLLQKRS